jgi:sugar lactone lactonase YvrE/enterochelin esterase-like enzyme
MKFSRVLSFLVLFLSSISRSFSADDYAPGPDSRRQEGVPQGEVNKYTFEKSRIFPGTWREYWVYVPKQYDPTTPACVYVGQDGIGYNAPVAFDNLIHKREMPITIGVFVMYGRVRALDTNAALDRFNRSYEYDGLGDNYARFILEEILPDVEKRSTSDGRPIKLSTNGNDRCIAGASSGAICAFTAAWERPDAFRRVFSSIGTYVGLRGGNDYPTLIRKTEPKPVRIFLQDGSSDLNIYGGDWWMANQEMERALVFAGYEVNHVWGDGGHNGKHASAIFPDAMRWLWKDWPAEVKAGAGSSQLKEILIPGEGWQVVSSGHRFTEGPAVNTKGEVFFTDIPNNRIHKAGLDGKVTVFAENTGGANGLMFGSDGKLYACANGRKAIVAYDDDGHAETIVEDVESNDLVALPKTGYFTDPGNKRVWFVNENREKTVVDTGIARPNGIITSPDQSLLYVADTAGQFVFSFQIQPDGSLKHKQRYFHLHLADGSTQSGADGMTVDRDGRLYVATELGLQVCDQAGRVNVIIPKPQRAWLSNVVFGGANLDELYVTCGDKVFKRKTRVKGVLSFQPLIKPQAPRL